MYELRFLFQVGLRGVRAYPNGWFVPVSARFVGFDVTSDRAGVLCDTLASDGNSLRRVGNDMGWTFFLGFCVVCYA